MGVGKILLRAFPVQVLKKIFDILLFAAWLVVRHEGVFPHIKSYNGRDSWQVAKMLLIYPILNEPVGLFVIAEHYPADAAGGGNVFKYFQKQ